MRITFNPHNRKAKRSHGFLSRMKSSGGKKVLNRRRAKGREKLTI